MCGEGLGDRWSAPAMPGNPPRPPPIPPAALQGIAEAHVHAVDRFQPHDDQVESGKGRLGLLSDLGAQRMWTDDEVAVCSVTAGIVCQERSFEDHSSRGRERHVGGLPGLEAQQRPERVLAVDGRLVVLPCDQPGGEPCQDESEDYCDRQSSADKGVVAHEVEMRLVKPRSDIRHGRRPQSPGNGQKQ